MEKKPWFALVSFILLNVLGHDLVRQVKNCSKPQALRAIPSLMLKGTATGQIICDIIIYSDVYEGSEVLMRDQDLMILVRAEEESPQRKNFLSHLLTRMCILYIVNSLTIAEKERSKLLIGFAMQVQWKRQTMMFTEGGSRENRLVSSSLAGLLYEQPGCRAIHRMNTLKLCRLYRELLSG